MKKIISFFMIVAMLVSMAIVSTNAAGMIYYTDTFDGDELSNINWKVDGNLFYVEEGKCKGWADAVANQSFYDDEYSGASKLFKYFSAQIDVEFYDYDREGEDHWAGIWWKDYIPESMEESPSASIPGTIYMVRLHIEQRQVQIDISGDYVPEDLENPVAVYDLPADYEIKVDASTPSVSKLGMRVTANEVSAYLDGQKVISYPVETTLAQFSGSPVILFNTGMYIGFDNFVVASDDYQLFASDLVADPNPPADDNNNDVTPPADDNNNDVTPPADDNNDVTPPADDNNDNTNDDNTNNQQQNKPADTNQGGGNKQPQTGTQTGDAAIVVLAVMIVALGTAIAVKKISVR